MSTPKPFQRTFPIHIGGQTRQLRFSHDDLLFATAMLSKLGLPSSPREALLFHKDVGVVCVLAAAGLRHQDKKASPRQVTGWLDQGLGHYHELEAAVTEGLDAAYFAMDGGVTPSGEATAPAPAPPPTTPTTPSTPGDEP